MNWIHWTQDRVQRSAVVNTVQEVLVQQLGHIPVNVECTNVEQSIFPP